MKKNVHIIGGGTLFHIRSHLALSAPAYGTTAKTLKRLCEERDTYNVKLHLTKMAGGEYLETNEDVKNLLHELVSDPATKIIFMNAAMCDFSGQLPIERR